MMSTSLGTPPKLNFFDILARSSFRETDSLASCDLMSSAAIAEVTRSRISACDGPPSGCRSRPRANGGEGLPSALVPTTISGPCSSLLSCFGMRFELEVKDDLPGNLRRASSQQHHASAQSMSCTLETFVHSKPSCSHNFSIERGQRHVIQSKGLDAF